MRFLRFALLAALASVVLSPRTARAVACTACGEIPCDRPEICKGLVCWCKPAGCHLEFIGCNGSGGGQRPAPGSLTGGIMTLDAAAADFDGDDSVVNVLELRSGWDVVLDDEIENFTVTGRWEEEGWYTILSAIVDDAGYCMDTNTSTHVVTVEPCS